MAHSLRHIKAKEDDIRIKEQCNEKRMKDELALSLSIDKAVADHIDVLFLWNK